MISRCWERMPGSNVVCFFHVAELDRIMDARYDSCSIGNGLVNLDWSFNVNCRSSDVS